VIQNRLGEKKSRDGGGGAWDQGIFQKMGGHPSEQRRQLIRGKKTAMSKKKRKQRRREFHLTKDIPHIPSSSTKA